MSSQIIELKNIKTISNITSEFVVPNSYKDADDYKLTVNDIDCIFEIYKIGYTRGDIKRCFLKIWQ